MSLARPSPGAPLSPPAARPFLNPYLAGIGIGLTLLTSFLTLGAGLGASSAIARASAVAADAVAPAAVARSESLAPWFADGSPLRYYLVWMAVGVVVGGGISALVSRRTRPSVERGPRSGVPRRLALALAGGVLVGFASRLAGGCTSGQALTGGSLLADGSWAFMGAVFAGGFLAAPLVRRQWQ